MDIFLGKNAGATLQKRMESLRNVGWIISKDIDDIQLDYAFTTVVQIKEMTTKKHGTVSMVDLRLSNDIENVPLDRRPVTTAEELPFDATAFGLPVKKGEVYMLCGAKILLNLQRERSIRFPPITESTASIVLPAKADAIVSMMEIFSGGFGAWTMASTKLPMTSILRIDNDGMAVASTLLNDADAVLHNMDEDQETFSLFWGEAVDLRWVRAIHGKNVEVACASPPSDGYKAAGDSEGLKNGKASIAWMQLFIVARLTQRRVFVIETLPGLARHDDLQVIIRIMRWAGYTTTWYGFLDSSCFVPIERKRFFLICWNTADTDSLMKPFQMMKFGPREPKQCLSAIWHMMPGELLSTVKLRPMDITKVTSRELLPKYQQNIPGSPLHIRIINQAKPAPPLLGNYRHILDTPWVTLKKRGLNLPLVFQGAEVRMISRWELLRLFGLPATTILPDNEDDAHILLGQALTPAQAIVVLASVVGHRAEDPMDNDTMLRYLDAGLQELETTWCPFSNMRPFCMSGWSMLVRTTVETTPTDLDQLRTRLQASHIQLKGRTARRKEEEPDPREYKLFMTGNGYSTIVLDDSDSVTTVNAKIAEFMLLPENKVAVTKLSHPTRETQNWILAGEIPDAWYEKVLILVDPAVPAAYWMSHNIDKRDLSETYADHHKALPDIVTLNDEEVMGWPISLVSGDVIRLRWDGHSSDEAWKELDVFKKLDEDFQAPPDTPQDERPESSEGGNTEDPEDASDDPPPPTGALHDGDAEGHSTTAATETVPPTVPYEVTLSATDTPTQLDYAPTNRHATKRRCTDETRELARLEAAVETATVNYASIQSNPPMANAVYMSFQNQVISFAKDDPRPLERIAEDEWGVQSHMIYFTLGTKVLGKQTMAHQLPIGATVILRGRLRGGTGQAVQKLRAMLSSKGVPDENLDSRIQEIRSHIGDAGIKEAYSSWDPWTNLKAKMPTRLVKEAEVKAKPRAKSVQSEDQVDPMQLHDPWGQALKERGMWKLETSFFKMEDGSPPPSLDKITHGARGIAFINEREAEVLTQSQEVMSDHELAALVVAAKIQNPGKFSIKDIETPCRSKDNDRILVRAQLLNLGAKMITLQDEGSVLTVDEIDAVVVACEAINEEMEGNGRALDPDYKVIWFNELQLSDLIMKANMEQQAYGIVRNKSGHGIRVRSSDFTKMKQKWQPAWKPLENTPYNLQVKMHYELQNMPLCCTKAEVQRFLSQINWEALALKQIKPRTWLIGAANGPDKRVHLAAHGTVLIAEKLSKGGGKGKSDGKGATGKGRPWWVAGASTTPAALLQKQTIQTQPQMTMDMDANELEDKIQKKMDQMHQESMASTRLLRQDFLSFQKEVIAKQKEQDKINETVATNVQSITTSLSAELTQHVQNITSAITAQRTEFAQDLRSSQISLKEELMGEMRTQMGAMRKRTPSPSNKEDEAKKAKQ
ncbi:unnamed protein product [Symbiodinium sp. CCMP2456]|nr:unnamed protein product [Symbiodinium sp. CCMP2456]